MVLNKQRAHKGVHALKEEVKSKAKHYVKPDFNMLCVCTHATAHGWSTEGKCRSQSSPSLGPQAWWQVPIQNEPPAGAGAGGRGLEGVGWRTPPLIPTLPRERQADFCESPYRASSRAAKTT